MEKFESSSFQSSQNRLTPEEARFFENENFPFKERMSEKKLYVNPSVLHSPLLAQKGITFPLLIKLARYHNELKKEHIHQISITEVAENKICIALESREFSNLEVILNLNEMTIYNENCFLNDSFKNTNAIVFRGFVSQALLAQKLGFTHMYGHAAGAASSKKQGKARNVGYYYRHKLGFFHDEHIQIQREEIQKLIKKFKYKSCSSLNELLSLVDEDGDRIGLLFWEKYGVGVPIVFDLAPESQSFEILRSYAQEKKDINPDKYRNLSL